MAVPLQGIRQGQSGFDDVAGVAVRSMLHEHAITLMVESFLGAVTMRWVGLVGDYRANARSWQPGLGGRLPARSRPCCGRPFLLISLPRIRTQWLFSAHGFLGRGAGATAGLRCEHAFGVAARAEDGGLRTPVFWRVAFKDDGGGAVAEENAGGARSSRS